ENDDHHNDGHATEHQPLDIRWKYPRWGEPLVGYTWNLTLVVCHGFSRLTKRSRYLPIARYPRSITFSATKRPFLYSKFTRFGFPSLTSYRVGVSSGSPLM